MMNPLSVNITAAGFFIVCIALLTPSILAAQSTQEQINEHASQINKLNQEIAQYEQQLAATSKQKQTLQNELSKLDLQRKKLQASINVTKNQISSTQLQINQLDKGIEGKESTIESNKAGLSESIRRLHEADGQSLALSILASDDLTTLWSDMDAQVSIQDAVREDILNLQAEKQSLTETKTTAEEKRAELLAQQRTLQSQQGSLDATRRAQNELLAQTKSQESTYQQILKEKQAQKASFEAALANLEAELNYTVDPSKIPSNGKILRYPLDSVRITQYFGNTAFARSGAYSGKGHNGMDFAAPIGTPVKAALSGTVLGTGNTDEIRGCYSFGKWVMVKHANGLNTLYAHLSQINVAAGQAVGTGAVLGYSGNTGYSTGPHLHFGVYASASTQIMRLGAATKSATPCANATMPITPLTGYLNPLNYL